MNGSVIDEITRLLKRNLGATPVMITLNASDEAVIMWRRTRRLMGPEYGTHIFGERGGLFSGHYFGQDNAYDLALHDFHNRIDTI